MIINYNIKPSVSENIENINTVISKRDAQTVMILQNLSQRSLVIRVGINPSVAATGAF